MKNILSQYKNLLETIDAWFDQCLDRAGEEIVCKRSCTGCCRGLFDISLLDARLLQEGFLQLELGEQQRVLPKAEKRLAELQQQWPQFNAPYILNRLPHKEWQQMPEEDETPCPLLSDAGLCLVYEYRPMTCRLHGLPNVDISGEVFSEDYCTLNFTNSTPRDNKELRWHFRETFAQEFDLLGQFSKNLTGTRQLELDTFIPTALLIDFKQTDWTLATSGKTD